ncbi:aquaporin [Streptomyces sp. NPDC026672]|uniref:aquaporin n=1 Tax=unclassified Streptomyces TaxID=2593676 RepID=UPI0033C35CE7
MASSVQGRAELARHACYEFVSTAVLFAGVVSMVRLFALPDSPLAIGTPRLMFATAGALVALLLGALMYAPTGRASGGHFNPGVTVFLWADGLFPGRAVVPYVVAQLAGSVAGPGLARLLWGDPVTTIGYAAVAPAPETGPVALFLIETAALAAVLAAVALVMIRPRLHVLVPAVIAVGVGVVVASLGPVTGASINPARAFGPALLSGQYDHLWTYMLSPVVAGALVGVLHRALRTRRDTSVAPASA